MEPIFTKHDTLPMSLHPDDLFALPYEQHALDTAPFTSPHSVMRIDAVADWGIRIRASASSIENTSVTEQLGLVEIPQPGESQGLFCDVDDESGAWFVRRANGTPLLSSIGGIRFSTEAAEYSGERFVAAFDFPEDEHIYGFGGRVAPLCRRGQTADMFAVKTGRLSGDYGGFPIPYYISTKGYAVFINNPWPHLYFDMGATDPGQWWVYAPGGSFDLIVIDGPRIRDIVRRFTEIVGRTPEPQRWWFGFWTSALAFATADEVESVGNRLRDGNYPCDALVIDGPWRGGPEFLQKYMTDGEYPTNDLNWHPDFGDGPGMVKRLGEKGFKIVLHQNSRSWLKDTVDKGVKDGTIRQEGREAVVTFGTEAGEKFYHDAIRPRHEEGIGMWWLDHGDRVSGELLPGIPSRNTFGAMWAKCTQHCAEEDGVGRRLSLIRGACIGGQRSAIPWPGDTRFGIDYFMEDVWFCMNAGLSGFPVTSADLGGFMSAKDSDPPHNTAYDEDNLARRLCQAILVLPVPRMHQCDSEPAKLPWNCPEHIQILYRQMLDERYRLTPYYYSYAVHASKTGDPIVRPLVYLYQNDPEALTIDDQCMIGDWLMAAPVFEKGAVERSVYFPEGDWYCWWTGKKYGGNQRATVEAPLCEPCGLPLFVRAGAIIPTQELTQHLDGGPPTKIKLRVYPATDGSTWTMEEENGQSSTFTCSPSGEITVDGAPLSDRFSIQVRG